MKKLLAILLSCCLLTACVSALAESAEEAPADLLAVEASNGLTVVTGIVYFDDDETSNYIDCYIYAEIRNDSDVEMEIDGLVEALDAEGTVVNYDYPSLLPSCVAPGGVAYLSSSLWIAKTETIATSADIASMKITVGKNLYGYGQQIRLLDGMTAEMAQGVNFLNESQPVVRVTIVNNTDSEIYKPCVVAGAYDEAGKLLFMVNETFVLSSGIHIPAGSTLILDLDTPWILRKHGVTADSVASLNCLVYTQQ